MTAFPAVLESLDLFYRIGREDHPYLFLIRFLLQLNQIEVDRKSLATKLQMRVTWLHRKCPTV